MSADKILSKWKSHIPPEERIEDVLQVLNKYFERVENPRRGSHIKVYDSYLKRFNELFPTFQVECRNGKFDIPRKGGQTVKKHYIERIIDLIEVVEKMKESGR